MEDPLVIIEQSQWPELVNIYPGPEGITARVTIKTQIVNIKRIPDLSVKFYAPYGKLDKGLVIIFNNNGENEISVFCLNDDKSVLLEALVNTNIINKNIPNVFCCIMPQVCPLIMKLVEKYGNKHVSDSTVIAKISREIAKSFVIPDCPGMTIKTLEPKYALEIDEAWPHRHPGSVKYFEYLLEKGYGVGFVDENNELVGWIFTNLRGDLHSLHVKDKYRRKGIGQILIKFMSKNIANNDIEVFGCVVTNNMASKALFSKCGFEFSYVTTWTVIFPKENQ